MQFESTRSLRRAYIDWVEDRVEEYKEQISRDALLSLAEQVVEELRVTRKGQYLLTELLLCSAVDRKIKRMLRLPGYKTWLAQRLNGNGSHPPPPEPSEELSVFSTQEASSEGHASGSRVLGPRR